MVALFRSVALMGVVSPAWGLRARSTADALLIGSTLSFSVLSGQRLDVASLSALGQADVGGS